MIKRVGKKYRRKQVFTSYWSNLRNTLIAKNSPFLSVLECVFLGGGEVGGRGGGTDKKHTDIVTYRLNRPGGRLSEENISSFHGTKLGEIIFLLFYISEKIVILFNLLFVCTLLLIS